MRYAGWLFFVSSVVFSALLRPAPAGDDEALHVAVGNTVELRETFRGFKKGQWGAIREAMERRRTDVVDDLVALLTDEDEGVIRSACTALTGLGQRAAGATPALLPLLEHENEHIRARAIQALGSINKRPPELLPALQGRLKDDYEHGRDYAAHALGRIGYEAVPILIANLASASPKLQRIIGRYLAEIRPVHPGVIEAIAERAEDPGDIPGGAMYWIRMLGRFGEAGLPHILPHLDRPASSLKRDVIMLLQGMGAAAREALPMLRKLLADPKWKDLATFAIKGIEESK